MSPPYRPIEALYGNRAGLDSQPSPTPATVAEQTSLQGPPPRPSPPTAACTPPVFPPRLGTKLRQRHAVDREHQERERLGVGGGGLARGQRFKRTSAAQRAIESSAAGWEWIRR